jgi:hypothetical protein
MSGPFHRLVGKSDRATERDRQAAADDEKARVSEQRMRDLPLAADLRDKAAAGQPPGSGDAGPQQWQLDRARDRDDREAIREMLVEAGAARQAAWHGRCAAGQDRVAARADRGGAQADRQDAACDRQAARADRDQAVIDSEEEDPPPGG